MGLRNMLKICLVFCKSESQYACKRYAYEKTCRYVLQHLLNLIKEHYEQISVEPLSSYV